MMEFRNIFAGLLTSFLVLSILTGFVTSTVYTMTTEESLEEITTIMLRSQIESELGEDFITDLEDGETECEEVEEIFLRLPYECEVIVEEGFKEAFSSEIEEMMLEMEELQEVNNHSRNLRLGSFFFSAMLVLLIFVFVKPTSKAFKYLGLIALIIGVLLFFSEIIIHQGITIAMENAMMTAEEEVPEQVNLAFEDTLESVIEMDTIQKEFERARNTGVAFFASGFLLVFVYGFKDKVIEKLS